MGNEQSVTKATAAVTVVSSPVLDSNKKSNNQVKQKSLLTRSQSIRNTLEQDASPSHQSQQEQASTIPKAIPSYLPRNMTQGQPGGIVMPRYHHHHHNSHSATTTDIRSGEASPQYGFYVNITPPSPPMYAPKKPSCNSMASTAASSVTSATTTSPPPQARTTNPIFQGLMQRQQQQQNGRAHHHTSHRTSSPPTPCFPTAPL